MNPDLFRPSNDIMSHFGFPFEKRSGFDRFRKRVMQGDIEQLQDLKIGLAGPDGREIRNDGYQRQPVGFVATTQGLSSDCEVIFAGVDWAGGESVSKAVLYDNESGKIMAFDLRVPQTSQPGDTLRFDPGSITISLGT
jgi:hypothetical protein